VTAKAFKQGQGLTNAMPQAGLTWHFIKVMTIMPFNFTQNFGFASFAGQVHQHIYLQNGVVRIHLFGPWSGANLDLSTKLVNNGK
jgi:hypothetical protein